MYVSYKVNTVYLYLVYIFYLYLVTSIIEESIFIFLNINYRKKGIEVIAGKTSPRVKVNLLYRKICKYVRQISVFHTFNGQLLFRYKLPIRPCLVATFENFHRKLLIFFYRILKFQVS